MSQSRLMYIFYLTDTMPCVSRVTSALLFMVLSLSSLSHSWVSSQTAHYKQHTYIVLFYSWQFGALWELSQRWWIYPDINSPVHILFLSGKSSMHYEKCLKFFVLTVTYILFIDFYCIYSFIFIYIFLSIYIYSTFKQQKLTQSALETVQLQKPIFILLFFSNTLKAESC